MWQKVPTALGVESILTNVGAVSNRGFDLTFGGIPVSTKTSMGYKLYGEL